MTGEESKASYNIKDRKGSWLIHPYAGWIALGLTIIISVVLDRLIDVVGWQMLLAVGVTVFVCFAFIDWIVVRYHVAPLIRFRIDLMDKFSYYKDRKFIKWLLITEEMVREEAKIDKGEIWVASPDLLEDLPEKDIHGGHFCDVVKGNLNQGVKYTYFVPDTTGMHTKVNQLKSYYDNSTKLAVKYLPTDSFFFLVGGLDVTIHNPLAEEGVEPIMYLGIPSRDGERGQYQACTNRTFTDNLIDRLRDELEKESVSSQT